MKCTAVEKVLAKLPGARQAGENQWLAKCPSHDDAKASLSVGLGDDGRALLRCHAGCAVESVVAAIGLKMADLMPNGQDATPTKAPAKPKTPNTMTAKSDPEAPPPWRRPIETTYDYTDEQGAVLFQAVRFGDGLFPRFMQRHQGNGNRWTWNIKGVRRVLYGLPMLLAADPHRRVFIVEGEKDVDRLLSLDMIATCNPMGAGSWLDEYSEHLKGRHCCIIADNDHPGRKHADEVARSLQGVAAEARILELPGLPVAGDVSDWLDAGGTRDELKKLVKQTPVYGSDATEGPTKDDDSDGSDRSDDRKASKSGGRSQSSELVDLCEASGVEVFHEPGIGGDAYATIVVAGHRETYRLRSREFRRWLARQFWTSCGKAPNSQATQDALSVLAGKAHFECPECRVHLRLAEHDGAVYLDLGNGEWEAVEITPSGWRVVAEPPVRFRRTRGMRALPYPSTDGDIAALRPFLNLASNDAWILVTAFLLGTLKPAGPFPILVVNGEQGSCKSSLCRALRSLVDPNISDLRATPRDERDLVISANNGWLVAFDNLSHIRTWLSDALCRLATGGGFSTRELFTDQDEVILDVQRPIILNGIEELVTRGDLLDRSICITLPTIETGRRKTETEFWGAFERAKPRILGGLLNAVSTALKNVASTRLRLLPRMADFATWVVSAESALPFEAGAFMSAYNTNLNLSNAAVIEASATGPAIVQLVTTQGRWEGTASELLTALSSNSYTEEKDRKRRDWPDNPQSMSNAVRRLAPALRASDIDVDFGRKAKRRRITLESSRNSSSFASSSSQTEFSGQKQGLLHDGRHDADDATANCLRHGDNGDSESETTIPSDDDANDANDARMRDSSGGHHSNDGDDWGTV